MSAVAGIATIDITPPVGIDLLGYARPSSSDGILDRLEATALVLDLPMTRLAVITVDHVGMLVSEVTLLREQIAAALAIPASHVMVLFTHTHSGPDTEGANDLVRTYRQVLHANLLHVAKEALANLRPCTVAWGVTAARIGVNRREHHSDGTARMGTNLAGPVDKRVGVLRIDDTLP